MKSDYPPIPRDQINRNKSMVLESEISYRPTLELIKEKLGLIKIEQQTIGRFDVYRFMDDEGIDVAIINKIKDKFNDRKDYP